MPAAPGALIAPAVATKMLAPWVVRLRPTPRLALLPVIAIDDASSISTIRLSVALLSVVWTSRPIAEPARFEPVIVAPSMK